MVLEYKAWNKIGIPVNMVKRALQRMEKAAGKSSAFYFVFLEAHFHYMVQADLELTM